MNMYTNLMMFVILQYVVKLVIKPIIISPVTRQPALPWHMATILYHTRWEVVLMLAPEYEIDVTTHNEVMAQFS